MCDLPIIVVALGTCVVVCVQREREREITPDQRIAVLFNQVNRKRDHELKDHVGVDIDT